MTAPETFDAASIPGLIDRLVCGELDDPGRRTVLGWLEADAARWRMCGLAFLEAQEWGLAMKGWISASAAMPCPASARSDRDSVDSSRRARARRMLTAAALAVAFVAGIGVRDLAARKAAETGPDLAGKARSEQAPAAVVLPASEKPAFSEPLLAELEMQVVGGLGQPAPVRIPVVPASLGGADSAARPTEIPEYVRQQWERRGYDVSVERRYLFAKLPDGQKVAVPIEQLRVNPKPIHIN